jgi:hypothetical protein
MMHPARTPAPRATRRTIVAKIAAQHGRMRDPGDQATGYRLERQALAAAELARMIASYHSHMEA